MQCDICFRAGGHGEKKLHFLCPTDARNLLYEPRIQNARVLLESDALNLQVTSLLSNDKSKEDKATSQASPTSMEAVSMSAEKDQTIDRTQQIITRADELRAKVDLAKNEIAKRKAMISRRNSDLASATNGVDTRRARQIEDVEKATRMTKYKWNQVHATTASSRAFLCGEAAKLYGLKRARTNTGGEEFQIGGVAIVDLKSLNTASPAQISTALSHTVHLLMLSTHYLAIRLPAEITLPHRDYPLPTIFPIPSSYKYIDVPFPGTTPSQSSNTSPADSRYTESRNHPHPRPLFITKPLPLLATEDPSGYGLFLEGITLLAYDVAWVCKSQGIPVGDENGFEDICNIGRNLYHLLIGPKPRSAPSSRAPPSAQSTPTKGSRDTEVESDGSKATITTVGRYSHGTAHSFLGSAEGTEFIRSWKLLSPMKLVDKLKGKLLSEVANAEWEVLDADAWAVDDEPGRDALVVGEEHERERNRGMQSFMSMRTVVETAETLGGEGERKPGTSGWTKLRG
ncbi:unnamed protein product [Diplocarpon coronariae]